MMLMIMLLLMLLLMMIIMTTMAIKAYNHTRYVSEFAIAQSMDSEFQSQEEKQKNK